MKIEWKLNFNPQDKEKVKEALNEWLAEFNKIMLEYAGKEIKIPGLTPIPMPIFGMKYEDDGKDLKVKLELPLPSSRFFKILFYPQLRKGKKQLEKFFESRGLQVKIK